ncbi:carboxymethylenebutenolidase [Microthyrium microscopicum]|uniref:Carboxymethylenebutenolidase n=1 Tax=Microthyrium microscopicum TaxID=703497 RepID=A0A6A6UIK5_9PEZI|nr:carboxymethylenebutenolidase [Microthyrium microscopicum]
MNGHSNGTSGGFLSFNSQAPRLFITAEDEEFDLETIQHWKDEGYEVSYHPMGEGGKVYAQEVKSWSTSMKLGQHFGIIAYGDAAVCCLDIATKPIPHCTALICYYPTSIPHPNQKYPTNLNLVVHLAESQGLAATFPTYVYPEVQDGFAEHDLDMFDAIAADLTWTRSLTAIRKGLGQDADLENVKDSFTTLSITEKNATAAVALMSEKAHVNYAPTGTGGIGRRALFHFYKDFFIPGSPPTLKWKLISRTTGVDRVVDEMVVSFKHTQEVPWILPGVPPTNRFVQVPVVSIVAIRGDRLISEHVYWDQASVLVQIGALDPKFVPKQLASKGCKKLPMMGADEAKKVLNVSSVPSNLMIDKW